MNKTLTSVYSTVTHSLKFFLTGSSGIPSFPEFVKVVTVDDVEAIYCDSNTQKAVPKQDWMERVMADTPAQYYTAECLENQQVFKETIEVWMQRFNHSRGIYTVLFYFNLQ